MSKKFMMITMAMMVMLSGVNCATLPGGSIHTDIQDPPQDDAEVPWWYDAEPIDADKPLYSYLHEGNGCTQDKKLINNGKNIYKLNHPWNDEARSIHLRGSRGTMITVYDKKGYALVDDYAVIKKLDNTSVCIPTFENNQPGKWVRHRGYIIWYSGGNGLDGKVSSVRWGKWW